MMFADENFGLADFSGTSAAAAAIGGSFAEYLAGLDQIQATDLTVRGADKQNRGVTKSSTISAAAASSTLSFDSLYTFPLTPASRKESDQEDALIAQSHSPEDNPLW